MRRHRVVEISSHVGTVNDMTRQINFGRKVMNKLWYAAEGSEDDDVSDAIINWMMDNLMTTKNIDEFSDKVEMQYRNGIRKKMKKMGYTHIPPFWSEEKDLENMPSVRAEAIKQKKRQQRQEAKEQLEQAKRPRIESAAVGHDQDLANNNSDVAATAATTSTGDSITMQPCDEPTMQPCDEPTVHPGDEPTTVATVKPVATGESNNNKTSAQASASLTLKITLNQGKEKEAVAAKAIPLSDVTPPPKKVPPQTTNPSKKSAAATVPVSPPKTSVPVSPSKTSPPVKKPPAKDKPRLPSEERMYQYIEAIRKQDKYLGEYIEMFYSNTVEINQPHLAIAAIAGCLRENMSDIWLHHHATHGIEGADQHELDPPLLLEKNKVAYNKPGEDFVTMGRDCLHVIDVFLKGCDHQGLHLDRYHWEFMLLHQISEYLPQVTGETRRFALLVCLVLSAASKDVGCIAASVELCKRGLLDVNKLSEASQHEIYTIIKPCGIGKKRAEYLSIIANTIVNDFDGVVPESMEDLMGETMPGIGRKTGVLFRNEALGLFEGIGCDKHVALIAKCLGLYRLPEWKTGICPQHVENSLREWVPHCNFKDTNKLFGCMAQLVTQLLAKVETRDQVFNMRLMVKAMEEHIHKPYHVELLWFVIARTRKYYEVNGESELESDDNEVAKALLD